MKYSTLSKKVWQEKIDKMVDCSVDLGYVLRTTLSEITDEEKEIVDKVILILMREADRLEDAMDSYDGFYDINKDYDSNLN